jgi:hypothetical protein
METNINKFTQPKNCKNLSEDVYAFAVNRSVTVLVTVTIASVRARFVIRGVS